MSALRPADALHDTQPVSWLACVGPCALEYGVTLAALEPPGPAVDRLGGYYITAAVVEVPTDRRSSAGYGGCISVGSLVWLPHRLAFVSQWWNLQAGIFLNLPMEANRSNSSGPPRKLTARRRPLATRYKFRNPPQREITI